MGRDESLIPMEVKALMTDPVSHVPIVILRNEDSARFLPIWIGLFEANAIAMKLQGVDAPRPMTHDLTANLLDALGAEVQHIVITDLADSTFYAEIVLGQGGDQQLIDARPSDAIALALRLDAPILVADSVLEKAKSDEKTERLTEDERIKKILEDLEPEDLGEYEM